MKLTIVDDGSLEGFRPNVVLWSRFSGENSNCILSIPERITSNPGFVRSQFLRWIFKLGETQIQRQRVVDILSIRPELSYWWLMSISHTPNLYEAEWINDAVKCLVFEDWCSATPKITAIELVSSNKVLHEVMARFCNRTGRFFSSVITCRRQDQRRVYSYGGSAAVKAAALLSEAALPTPGPRPASGSARWCFIDHLTYLKPEAIKRKVFASAYWEQLVSHVESREADITWVHNFFPNELVPTLAAARRLINEFNLGTSGQHLLTEQWLEPSDIWSAARDTVRLRSRARVVRSLELQNAGCPNGSDFDFWPFLAPGLRASLSTSGVYRQSLRIASLVRLFSRLPRQDLGVYIQENQPWEMGLIYAWRRAGHGALIGVQHSTIRFWDLRNFYDPECYRQKDTLALPRPDRVAVNGPFGWRQYVDGGYPAEEVIRVEALRYAHLNGRQINRTRGTAFTLLVCGDNVPLSNEKLVAVVLEIAALLPPEAEVLFKSHPAAPFNLNTARPFRYSITHEPLATAFSRVSAVITASTTSASLEAYCAGLPVAVFYDGETLNTSPLLGVASECFGSNATELVRILTAVKSEQPRPDEFFDFNDDLVRWSDLLDSAGQRPEDVEGYMERL